MEQADDLQRQIKALTEQVDEMRHKLGEIDARSSADGEGASSRRNFLRLGAGAALGALGVAATRVLPAAAATGGNFVLGNANLAENPTTIQGDSGTPPVQVLAAEAAGTTWVQGTTGTFAGPLQGLGNSGTNVDGVDGWAGGTTGFGVYGLSDSGYGAVGESSTGVALYARTSGRLLQDPLVAAGAPTYSPNNFEQVRDANGALWISVSGGAWKQVATTDMGFHIFPNPRRVWSGDVQPTGAGNYGPIDATTEVTLPPSWPGGASGVPAGAQAAFCAVQAYSAGVMTLYPDGSSDPGIANWSGVANGPLNLLYMFVPLSAAGKFWMHKYFAGKAYVDVWGYLK